MTADCAEISLWFTAVCVSVSLSGVHIFQWMLCCEWDDETGEINGFRQVGYDGEDFLSWDVKTNTWIAPKQQAVITKNSWNNNKAQLAFYKNTITQESPYMLKMLMKYGRSSLMRTGIITVSLSPLFISLPPE